ncbi:hypothetical protein LOC71_07220 [Rhodopirellula sp. JC740]|uniref:Uncharacterized protein n=1 Tax=Rhodopirellula halodulae TaxID=2894198 RepID=A0ABS8NES9_9BACT|nr:hypothetical protein [Rhodopirellula sp. JC740]
MSSLLKNALAFVAGVVSGSVVNMSIILVGTALIPVPDGVDMSDMERFSENLRLLKPVNFLTPFLAHAIGTLAGAWVAAKLAVSANMKIALGIGAFFLLGGIMMVAMYGGPLWFAILDLLVAYVPMGYLGGKLAGAKKVRAA